jgi:hypothetical protein
MGQKRLSNRDRRQAMYSENGERTRLTGTGPVPAASVLAEDFEACLGNVDHIFQLDEAAARIAMRQRSPI